MQIYKEMDRSRVSDVKGHVLRELDRGLSNRRYPWETDLAPARFSQSVLRRIYVDAQSSAVTYVKGIVESKQLEEAYDVDGVLVAAYMLDLCVECDGTRLLRSAVVEAACRRISAFEQAASLSGKGMTAWKSNQTKIKKVYRKSCVVPRVQACGPLGRPEQQALEASGWT